MKSIGKFKIIKNTPKPNISYPLVRLPSSHAHLVGEQAHVFEAEVNGKTLFIVSTDEDFTKDSVVVQPKGEFDLESRLESIEKQLSILQKSTSEESENKHDGPGEIRTPDLCRVKATS